MDEVVSSAQNKKTIFIIASVVLALVITALVYFLVISKPKTEVPEQGSLVTPPVVPETLDVTSKINELTNPVGEKLPDLNPVEKTNPFKNVYENPFK